MKYSTTRDKFSERIAWLIRLRWIAIIGVIFTVICAERIFGLKLHPGPIYIIAALLAISNAGYLIFFKYIVNTRDKDLYIRGLKTAAFRPQIGNGRSVFRSKKPRTSGRGASFIVNNTLANLQIFLDLAFLAALIHFSGGIENPFIFYFIFHMIIASILLTRRASFLQATFAVGLFLSMVGLEYTGILPHYCLTGFIPVTLHHNFIYIFGISFVFITTLYIAVYMGTSISSRLREREKSLEKANILLEEKDRIKSEYVLRVTHDIKEHLSAIQSCIEPVTEGITGALNEKQKDLLFRAENRAEKLLSFVKALLEITRIKLTRRIKFEEFIFAESMKTIGEDIEARARSKGISFDVKIDPSIGKIKGVRVYIEEAIMDLLANSVKYTPAGGSISFRAKDAHDRIDIEISDTGIGIPRDELPYVFDEFYRARNAKEVEKLGTGLGLSIARKIIELHKGKIWVKSEETRGTTFYIQLPK